MKATKAKHTSKRGNGHLLLHVRGVSARAAKKQTEHTEQPLGDLLTLLIVPFLQKLLTDKAPHYTQSHTSLEAALSRLLRILVVLSSELCRRMGGLM